MGSHSIPHFSELPSALLLVNSNATRRPGPPGPQTADREFLFIDAQADISQSIGIGRQKKAFLSKIAHQRRKQEAIDRLGLSCSTSRWISQNDEQHDQETRNVKENPTQVVTYMSQSYGDPFCTFSLPMSDSMNMYFYHCRWPTSCQPHLM
jgi:hypothetical protein